MGLLFQFVSSLPAWQLLLPFLAVKVLACYESLSPDLSMCLLFLWTSLSCPEHPNVVVVSHQGSFWVLLWKVCSSGDYLRAWSSELETWFCWGQQHSCRERCSIWVDFRKSWMSHILSSETGTLNFLGPPLRCYLLVKAKQHQTQSVPHSKWVHNST